MDISNKRYAAVGRCIYCLAVPTDDPVRLTDEHIIPFALGGNIVLPRSSCSRCATVTGAFEARILRGGLRGIKERLRFTSRSKARPKSLPIFCVNGDEDRRVDVSIDDYPALVMLPHFVGPRIAPFAGAPAVEQTPWLFVPKPDVESLRSRYGVTSWATNAFDAVAFGRMLAKTAHGVAVGEQGLDRFVPFLPGIILQERGLEFLRFVGTAGPSGAASEGDVTHKFKLLTEVAGGQRYLTCHLQLFASFGAPPYRIVVGQLREDFNPLLVPKPAPISSDPRSANWRLMISSEGEAGTGWGPLPPCPLQINHRSHG